VGGVLVHYTDPFLLRSHPLRGLRQWPGPRLLVCGDLHHGESPLDVLAAYLEAEPHDAVLLSFNPALLAAVRQRLSTPVRALPPTFFATHRRRVSPIRASSCCMWAALGRITPAGANW